MKRLLTAVLLAIGLFVGFLLGGATTGQAQQGPCQVPKSLGEYKGGAGLALIFEADDGTLTTVAQDCRIQTAVVRR